MELSDYAFQLEGLTVDGQCSIQIRISLNKLRILFKTEKEHTNSIINLLTQLFNNEAARIPNHVSSYNIAGDYGLVWLMISPEDALNENGRVDFWFPAQALNGKELGKLIQSVIRHLSEQSSFYIPESLFNTMEKREYKDVFPEPLYLSCKTLGLCLQSIFVAVEELDLEKAFVLTDKAIGKAAPSRYKANHIGTLFYNTDNQAVDSVSVENTPTCTF